MKNLIFLLVVLFSSSTYSQIKVSEVEKSEVIGEIAPMGQPQVIISKTSDRYIFSYQDINFQELKEAKSFTILPNEFEELYTLIIKGFNEKKNNELHVELSQDVLILKFEKHLGVMNLQIDHHVSKNPKVIGTTQYFTKKKIDKLFGKK